MYKNISRMLSATEAQFEKFSIWFQDFNLFYFTLIYENPRIDKLLSQYFDLRKFNFTLIEILLLLKLKFFLITRIIFLILHMMI